MTGFLRLRARRSVTVLAATSLVFAASVHLGWTPSAPWTPSVRVLTAAVDWFLTTPLVQVESDRAVLLRYEALACRY